MCQERNAICLFQNNGKEPTRISTAVTEGQEDYLVPYSSANGTAELLQTLKCFPLACQVRKMAHALGSMFSCWFLVDWTSAQLKELVTVGRKDYLVPNNCANGTAELLCHALCCCNGRNSARLRNSDAPGPVRELAAPVSYLVQKLWHLQYITNNMTHAT